MSRRASSAAGAALYALTVYLRGEGSVFRKLRELQEAQQLPASTVRARQLERLTAILDYARARSPYYSGIPAGGKQHPVERLGVVPLLTKADVQQHHASLLVTPFSGRVTRKTTGGSTGQAVSVTKDRVAIAAEMAASWLAYGWFGVRIGDRAARFWGQPVGLRRRLRFAAADIAMNRVRFSAFAFGEEDLANYWRRCMEFRPQYMYGYVSMLEAFARFVADHDLPGADLQLKSVITTAEVLTPPQRELIARVFDCAVQNEYGCGEVGPIAYECEHGSLHLMAYNHYVEFIREDGQPADVGETGHIVVTDLNNRAMPLIRYKVGDLGIPGGDCACGRAFPVLAKVWGREYDFVVDRHGRRYHGEFFMYLFEDLRRSGLGVAKFKVTQAGIDELLVEVVREGGGDVEGRLRMERTIAERVGGFRVVVRDVGQLPPRPNGKTVVVENVWLRSPQGGSSMSGSAGGLNGS